MNYARTPVAVAILCLMSACSRCGGERGSDAAASRPVAGQLPYARAAALPADAQAYAMVDLESILSEAVALAPGAEDTDDVRTQLGEQVAQLLALDGVPPELRGRVHPERARTLVAAAFDGDDKAGDEDSWVVVTDVAVLSDPPSEGGPPVAITEGLQACVRGGELLLGNGPVYSALADGTRGGGFDLRAAWPEGAAASPGDASYLVFVPQQAPDADLPEAWTEMGLRRMLVSGSPSGRNVVALDVDDDTAVRHFLGSAQAAVSERLTRVRPMTPPAGQGWLSYLELVDRALWSQISLAREGTTTTVAIAAPRCGRGGAAVYAIAALGWFGATEGQVEPIPFRPVEQRIAEDCAVVPGPPPTLPARFAGMPGPDTAGEKLLVLADVGALLRANLPTLFHLLPFALHPDDVVEALGPTPLGLNGLADPAGVLAVYAEIGSAPAGAAVLPSGARGFLPIPVPPGMVDELIDGTGWVLATPGMGAAPSRAPEPGSPWVRLEAALPDDAVLAVFGTRDALADLLREVPVEVSVIERSQLFAATLTAELGFSLAFFVGDGARAAADSVQADIDEAIERATQDMGQEESEAFATFIRPVRRAISVAAVGDDVVRVDIGRSGGQSRSMLVAGIAMGLVMQRAGANLAEVFDPPRQVAPAPQVPPGPIQGVNPGTTGAVPGRPPKPPRQ